MANIFQGESKVARCVREWDRLLREREWVDTEIFASIFSYDTISGEEMFGYEKAVKKAKKEIRLALQERGMLLREQADAQDNRRLLTAYPLDNKDPLHNLRIMAVVEAAMAFSRALQITYSPSFHETEEHIFHPQYLRNYNGRPYVYGVYENEEENNGLPFVALPVDRIVTARLTKAVSYRPGDQQAYEAQLRNVLGASPNFRNPEVLEVVIRSHDQKVHKLLLSKPLHHSIREQQPCTAEQTGLLTMRVQMTQELYNWILYYGKGIEVVEPAELRKRITIGLSQMVTYYNAK